MPKVRKEIPELEKLVQVGRKKFVRYEEGAQLYSMGVAYISGISERCESSLSCEESCSGQYRDCG